MRVQAGDPVFARALRYLDGGEATVLVLGARGSPGYAVVGPDRVVGRLSWPELPATVVADARSLLGTPGIARKTYGHRGERDGTGVDVRMHSFSSDM